MSLTTVIWDGDWRSTSREGAAASNFCKCMRTFVFAAIQFDVSLSSSHFRIHFRSQKHFTGSCQFWPHAKLKQCITWNLLSSAAPIERLTILNVRTCRWLALPHSSELWWRYHSLVADTIARVCCTKTWIQTSKFAKQENCESFDSWTLLLPPQNCLLLIVDILILLEDLLQGT